MISFMYSSAERSWSLASMVEARSGPSNDPLAWLTLAARSPCAGRPSTARRRRAPSDSPGCAPRAAGRPAIDTRPTPGSCEIFCATRVSTRFCRRGSGMVFDITAMVRMGASAGFTLL
jgi:hypothetical protein